MHLDLALLLSEAKGELRFYKSEVLKDVLYYSPHGKLVPFIVLPLSRNRVGRHTRRPLLDCPD